MTHSISPVTHQNPACFGVCCNQRKDCNRYHSIYQSGQEGYHVIDACDEIDGKRSRFISVHAVEQGGQA